jgi:hypothetical protein
VYLVGIIYYNIYLLPAKSRPALGPTQPLIQMSFIPGQKFPIRKADHSPQSMQRLRIHGAIPPLSLYGLMACKKALYYHRRYIIFSKRQKKYLIRLASQIFILHHRCLNFLSRLLPFRCGLSRSMSCSCRQRFKHVRTSSTSAFTNEYPS